MLAVGTTQKAGPQKSIWFLVALAIALCGSIDAILIVGLVKGFTTVEFVSFTVGGTIMGAGLLITAVEFNRLGKHN